MVARRAASRKGKGRAVSPTGSTSMSGAAESHEGAARGGAHNKENRGGFFESLTFLPPLPGSLPAPPGPTIQTQSQTADSRPQAMKIEPMSSPIRLPLPAPAGPSQSEAAPPASPPRTRTITLSYGVNHYTVNLDELPDDSVKITAILKETCPQAAQRDKWMIIASYYRAQGNHNAALMIVSAMVDGSCS